MNLMLIMSHRSQDLIHLLPLIRLTPTRIAQAAAAVHSIQRRRRLAVAEAMAVAEDRAAELVPVALLTDQLAGTVLARVAVTALVDRVRVSLLPPSTKTWEQQHRSL